jgi:hypothetical protein
MREQGAQHERGFALLLVFVMAAVIAISLYMEIPRVAFETQRNREQLLVERGEEYKRAIKLYVNKFKRYPPDLDALEKSQNVRFLRKRFKDPLTGKDEWRLIHSNGAFLTDSLVEKPPDLNAKREGTGGTTGFGGSFGMGGSSTMGQPMAGQPTAGNTMGAPGNGAPPPDPNQPPQVAAAAQFRPSDRGVMPAPGVPSQPDDPDDQDRDNQRTAPGMPVPGQIVEAPGQMPSGVPYPGQPQTMPSGIPYPGQPQTTPSGVPYPGQATPGQPVPGRGIPGQVVPGQVVPPQVIPGQIVPGQPLPGQTPGIIPGMPYPGQVQPGQPVIQPIPGQVPAYPQGIPFPGGVPQPQSAGTVYPGQVPGQTFPGQVYPGQVQPGVPGGSVRPGSPTPFPPGAAPFPQGNPMPFGQGPQNRPTTGQNQAIGMIRDILTNPRPGGLPGGQPQGGAGTAFGAGIAGVASTAEGESIRVYNDRTKYKEWEFVFDPNKEAQKAMGAMMQAGQGNPNQQPGSNSSFPGSNSSFGGSNSSLGGSNSSFGGGANSSFGGNNSSFGGNNSSFGGSNSSPTTGRQR